LLVGAADGAITATSVRTWYLSLVRPPGTPPSWVFGPVWGVLYVLMGSAAWLVWRRTGAARPLRLWGWQLLLNALWTPAFFGLRSPMLGLIVIVLLLILLGLTIRAFARVRRLAAWLLAPYFAWTAYAAYLNAGFFWLNQGMG
jgi:translocator protein